METVALPRAVLDQCHSITRSLPFDLWPDGGLWFEHDEVDRTKHNFGWCVGDQEEDEVRTIELRNLLGTSEEIEKLYHPLVNGMVLIDVPAISIQSTRDFIFAAWCDPNVRLGPDLMLCLGLPYLVQEELKPQRVRQGYDAQNKTIVYLFDMEGYSLFWTIHAKSISVMKTE
ncbi:MAG: hypothetical protein E7J78_17165 [Pantoea sp.]|nr:hypothetical protein [Pantoea sp.]